MRTVRDWRPNAKFGRTIEVAAVAGSGAQRDNAQDLAMFLRVYDLTVVSVPASRAEAERRVPPIPKLARAALAQWKARGPAPLLFLLDGGAAESPATVADLLERTRAARQAGIAQVGVRLVPAIEGDLPANVLGAGLAATVPRKGRARAIAEDTAAPRP
jgi:hypothetical protein